MRFLKPYAQTDATGEYGKTVLRIGMTAKERKAINKNFKTRRKFIDDMIYDGRVELPGCNCRHCQNDWDCCGSMVPQYPEVQLAKGGIKLVQCYVRNI